MYGKLENIGLTPVSEPFKAERVVCIEELFSKFFNPKRTPFFSTKYLLEKIFS